MLLDPDSPFGQRVARRLREERIIWLVTVDKNKMPQPRPVWFLWDGESFLIYSQPEAAKLRHIARNPRVALHFDGDGLGGDIIVFSGETRLDPDAPPAHEVEAYATKYQPGFARINMTAEQFARIYSVALRVTPTGLRGH